MAFIDKNEIRILKAINVLYLDDDPIIIDLVQKELEPYFKTLFTATNGHDALHKYKTKLKNKQIDIIISDINMPKIDGIEFIKNVRLLNKSVEVLLASGVTESDYLIDAINHGVSYFILKPIKINILLETLIKIAKSYLSQKIITNQKKELENYINAINKVAIITKTDLKGIITKVNDIFCKISGYSKEELIGSAHNIVRHPDMPKHIFKEMWQTIQSDKMWSGKVKNKAKNGTAYYTQVYIFPDYSESNGEKTGYIGIRYLITNEELQRIEFKRKVIQNVTQWRQKEKELYEQIEVYKEQVSDTTKDSFIEVLHDKLDKEAEKNRNLLKKIDDLEQDVILARSDRTKQFENIKTRLENIYRAYLEYKKEVSISGEKINTLTQENVSKTNKIDELNDIISQQKEVIDDLKDVIAHREEAIAQLKGGHNDRS